MTKYIRIFIIFLTLSACGQKKTEKKTPENVNEKTAESEQKTESFIECRANLPKSKRNGWMRKMITLKLKIKSGKAEYELPTTYLQIDNNTEIINKALKDYSYSIEIKTI